MSVVVTGGAGGLGEVLARAFAERGRNVVLFDVSPEVQGSARSIAEQTGVSVAAVRCDLCDSAAVERAWDEAAETVGAIDVVINNAGRFVSHATTQLTDEEWQRTLGVNLSSAFYMCRIAARRWPASGTAGAIVNVSSTAALSAQPAGAIDYGATKAGMLGMTIHLAVELGPHGIRTNAVLPSSFYSPMNRERLTRPEEVERSQRMIPLGRIAEPEEVASATVFLALDGSYLNGVLMPCDGGNLVQM